MSKPKEYKITVRMIEKERGFLDCKTQEKAMSASQYLRYIALNEKQDKKDTIKNGSINFLDKNIAKLTRMFIDSYFCTKAMATKQLTDEDAEIVKKTRAELYKEFGIEKKIK